MTPNMAYIPGVGISKLYSVISLKSVRFYQVNIHGNVQPHGILYSK